MNDNLKAGGTGNTLVGGAGDDSYVVGAASTAIMGKEATIGCLEAEETTPSSVAREADTIRSLTSPCVSNFNS
ncbi:hypothetical protein [Bradyrhizobium sp. WSM2793]|uniref:hypothetical protein n=1 Tax=Bradyrhizobium sp. WSM2793 TaxID=1038866 RepID=UPI0012FCB629|nr:hypothetical protein [Bradyrhizobium sp. WSM2793]